MDEMIEKFDVRDVKANPARFDIDKAISINAEHIRMLEPQDFLNRSVPYLKRDGVVSADSWDALTDREREVLTAAAPLVQPRVRLLGEVAGMVAPCCPPKLHRAGRRRQEAAEGFRSGRARRCDRGAGRRC